MKARPPAAIPIELNAVIVIVKDAMPYLLTNQGRALPSGPFETEHRTLEQGLRAWVKVKGDQTLGYVEQLYTFADRGRTADGMRSVSIGYLALMHDTQDAINTSRSCWYDHFPWEDHRWGVPSLIGKTILPILTEWKNAATNKNDRRLRKDRISIAFPSDPRSWNEELVLQRYELLWDAGLVAEAKMKTKQTLGIAMPFDHRRIVATAMARLRAKIKYRPVVFELLPSEFTLLQLQMTVEALAGIRLHKQNFRRLIETQGLVEETGAMTRGTSGRPAKLFAYRRRIYEERAVGGTKLPRSS